MTSFRRQVRFAEARNAVFLVDIDQRSLDSPCLKRPKGSVWKQIQLDAHSMKQTGYGILLRDSFRDCDEAAIQQKLNAFAREEGVRGLERYLSSQHDEERHCAKNNAIRCVLDLQKALKGKGTPLTEVWSGLAWTLRVHAQHAKSFARRMGIADEMAVSAGKSEEVGACDLVKQMHKNNARRSIRRPSIPDAVFELDSSDSESEKETGPSMGFFPRRPRIQCCLKTVGADDGVNGLGMGESAEAKRASDGFEGNICCHHKTPRVARTA